MLQITFCVQYQSGVIDVVFETDNIAFSEDKKRSDIIASNHLG